MTTPAVALICGGILILNRGAIHQLEKAYCSLQFVCDITG